MTSFREPRVWQKWPFPGFFVDSLPDYLLKQRKKVAIAHGIQEPGDPIFYTKIFRSYLAQGIVLRTPINDSVGLYLSGPWGGPWLAYIKRGGYHAQLLVLRIGFLETAEVPVGVLPKSQEVAVEL